MAKFTLRSTAGLAAAGIVLYGLGKQSAQTHDEEIGGSQLMGMDRIKFYGTGGDGAMLAICIPYDEKEQNCGYGNMVAINAGDNETAAKLYAKAIELGATDEGEPGDRVPGVFYGAYVATWTATSSASTS